MNNIPKTSEFKERPKTVLVIAGSDPSGGAGLQGDIKTCMANKVFAMGAVTALTVQNTLGVKYYQSVSPDLVSDQIRCVIEDVRPDAVKIGMLPSPETVKEVADIINEYSLQNVVTDPLLYSSSGHCMNRDVELTARAMEEFLFPLSYLVTPNLPEAEYFLSTKIVTEPEIRMAVAALLRKWECGAVLLKGGHFTGNISSDILSLSHDSFFSYISPRVRTRNSHGTGCALSSVIACGLAKGLSINEALTDGKTFIYNALVGNAGVSFGHGNGPIDFFCPITQ